jgi:thioredoxin reductase (NADPH)
MENIVIIGGGPAGLTAAIYAARAGLKPLVFAGSLAGGQLSLTSEVENFPGQDTILGAELVEKIRHQAEKFGTRILNENIVKVDLSKKPFRVYSSAKNKHTDNMKDLSLAITTRAIIIATGARALWLGLESETRLRGKGVSACATCDGFFFRGKDVAVVGGGDTALEEALTLSKFAHQVYLIHRRDNFRASHIMQERVFQNDKIKIIWNAQVKDILGQDKVEGIKLVINANQTNKKSEEKIINLHGVFVAIGHQPDTALFQGQLKMDERGYILKNFFPQYPMMTAVEGVFVAGDCTDHYYRQAIVAAGQGAAAAIDAERWLNRETK